MKIMFFGTGLFPLQMFKRLHSLTISKPTLINSLCLATNFSQDLSKKKKKESIHQYAIDNNISEHNFYIKETYIIDSSGLDMQESWRSFQSLPKNKTDLGLVCNFGYMLPSQIIDEFSQGLIVMHPSLLPKYRGSSPIQRALMNGELSSGLSFIQISKNKFDAGQILHQDEIQIEQSDRYQELSEKLSKLAADQVEHVLINYEQLKTNALEQDDALMTKAPKIKPNEAFANFEINDAKQIVNTYRGLYGSGSNLRTTFADKTIFFEDLKLVSEKEQIDLDLYVDAEPRSLWLLKKREFKKFIYVKCKDSWVRIDKFRFGDRSLIQESYTFIDQFMDKKTDKINYFE